MGKHVWDVFPAGTFSGLLGFTVTRDRLPNRFDVPHPGFHVHARSEPIEKCHWAIDGEAG